MQYGSLKWSKSDELGSGGWGGGLEMHYIELFVFFSKYIFFYSKIQIFSWKNYGRSVSQVDLIEFAYM